MDIVWCNFNEVTIDNKVISNQRSSDRISAIKDLLSGKMHGSLCNKLILNELIYNNKIYFLEGVDLWEDLYFTIQCFYASKKVEFLDMSLYNYRIDVLGSMTDDVPQDLQKIHMKIKVAEQLESIFTNTTIFYKEYISLRLRAKSDLLLFSYYFNPQLWINTLPTNFKSIFSCNEFMRIKIVYFSTKLRLFFIPKLYIKLRDVLTKS